MCFKALKIIYTWFFFVYAFAYMNSKVQIVIINCIHIQISSALSYYQNGFKNESKSPNKNLNFPHLAKDTLWNVEEMCVLYLRFHSLNSAHMPTSTPDLHVLALSILEKLCGLERNYLVIFEAKSTDLQWGLPPHALFLVWRVHELVELRKANSILYTTAFIQLVCSSSKCVTHDKEVTFKRSLAIFNNDS